MKSTIKALLKTRSPLHIAHPDNARMDALGRHAYGEKDFPMTSVQKLSLPFDIKSGEEQDKSRMARYPVIAANNVAGRLRRHAAKQVVDAIAAKGQKLSLHAYAVLMCGASTGKPDADALTFAEYKQARVHPYFGLFGGGPKMFQRRVRVHNALPVTPKVQELKGELAHPATRDGDYAFPDAKAHHMIQRWGFRRLDDLSMLSNIEAAEGSIENFAEAFLKRQAAITSEEGKENRVSTKTYSAIEFVVPGVLFDLTMELDLVTDAQVGLYLEALDNFAATERLGGYSRNGFGVFSLELVTLFAEDGSEVALFHNGRLNRNEPQVAKWLAAWRSAASELSLDGLEQLITVKEKDTKKKDKNKAKAGETTEA